MSSMGMQVELSMNAKGVQAALKDAQGAVVQTSQIIRSELGGSARAAGSQMIELKKGMGQARETAMFFTQSLGEFGPAGRTAQIAVSGIAGAIMGGGGVLLALSLAQAAVRLLVDWWKADAEEAAAAAKKHLEAAENLEKYNRSLSKDANAHIATLQGMKQGFDKLTEAQKAHNVVQEINVLRLMATAPAMKAMLDLRLKQAQLLEREIAAEEKKAKAAGAKPGASGGAKPAGGWEKSFDQQVLEAQAGIDAKDAQDKDKRDEERARRGQAALDARARLYEKDAARALKLAEEVKAGWESAGASMGQAMGAAFGSMLTGAQSVGSALKGILQAALTAVIDMALKQIDIAGIVAGAEAFKSQAGIPGVGPFLGAAAAAATMAAVHGMVGMISASGGADIGNYAPMAQLHPREMVLPAHIADPLRDSLAGGGMGGNVNITLHATDAKSVRRLLLDNGPALAEAIGKAARDGRRFG